MFKRIMKTIGKGLLFVASLIFFPVTLSAILWRHINKKMEGNLVKQLNEDIYSKRETISHLRSENDKLIIERGSLIDDLWQEKQNTKSLRNDLAEYKDIANQKRREAYSKGYPNDVKKILKHYETFLYKCEIIKLNSPIILSCYNEIISWGGIRDEIMNIYKKYGISEKNGVCSWRGGKYFSICDNERGWFAPHFTAFIKGINQIQEKKLKQYMKQISRILIIHADDIYLPEKDYGANSIEIHYSISEEKQNQINQIIQEIKRAGNIHANIMFAPSASKYCISILSNDDYKHLIDKLYNYFEICLINHSAEALAKPHNVDFAVNSDNSKPHIPIELSHEIASYLTVDDSAKLARVDNNANYTLKLFLQAQKERVGRGKEIRNQSTPRPE